MRPAAVALAAVLIGQGLLTRAVLAQARITSPESHFGFTLGSDRKMARWDRIVEYFGVLERESAGRMKVVNLGPTAMGNPFWR